MENKNSFGIEPLGLENNIRLHIIAESFCMHKDIKQFAKELSGILNKEITVKKNITDKERLTVKKFVFLLLSVQGIFGAIADDKTEEYYDFLETAVKTAVNGIIDQITD